MQRRENGKGMGSSGLPGGLRRRNPCWGMKGDKAYAPVTSAGKSGVRENEEEKHNFIPSGRKSEY